MYKLLLLDIDGTLRDEHFGIPVSAKKAMQSCQCHQCLVMICTGRSIGTIQDDVMALNVDGYIAGGGCYIQYHNEILCNQSFDQTMINQVISYLQKEDVACAIESQETVWMNQKGRDILQAMNHKKQACDSIQKQFIQEKIQYEDNLHTYKNQPIHKICLWSKENVYQHIALILKDVFTLAQYKKDEALNYYEIILKGYNKGDAVKRIQEKLGITYEETICFGDGLNDISMFEQAGVAIAMQKSDPKLKEIATSICEDVVADGIYKELMRRGIIERGLQ